MEDPVPDLFDPGPIEVAPHDVDLIARLAAGVVADLRAAGLAETAIANVLAGALVRTSPAPLTDFEAALGTAEGIADAERTIRQGDALEMLKAKRDATKRLRRVRLVRRKAFELARETRLRDELTRWTIEGRTS